MKTFNTNPYSQINTARYFLLVLLGAIAFFLVLVKLEPLSYLSQYSPANNAPQSQQPPKTPIMAAATLLTASVDNTKNDLNNNTVAGDKAVGVTAANSTPAASAKAFESAEKAKAVVKTTVLTKEAKSFLKQNDSYNNTIVKELAQVTDMQEFHFKNGRTSLDENAVLDKLDSTLWQCITAPTSYTKIIILGFTDNRGSKLANVKLGLKRAQGFKSFLIDKGIPEDKISVASFGPELPIATNNDAEGRARNRRVEFNLVGAGD